MRIVLVAVAANSKESFAPLPTKISQAKTVFIDNKTASAHISDEVYHDLTKWNRFTIVADKSKADLVLVLTQETHQAISSDNTVVTNQVGSAKIANGGGVYSYTSGKVTLTILDAHDDSEIWANTKAFSRKGATHDLVEDLKKRMEYQEKHRS